LTIPDTEPIAIIGKATFYQTSVFDDPVMILSVHYPQTSNPDAVDMFIIPFLYVYKDGEATGDITEQERAALFTVDEISGDNVVDGEFLNEFLLTSQASGEQAEQEISAALQSVHDWLAQQNP
jgi:hypothetical protein